jgi:hypothetical protein
MSDSPRKSSVDAQCPRCRKRYRCEINPADPPARGKKWYRVTCWQCTRAGKSEWAQAWIDKAREWFPEGA